MALPQDASSPTPMKAAQVSMTMTETIPKLKLTTTGLANEGKR